MTHLEQLKDALDALAATPEVQLGYLVEIGHIDNSRSIDQTLNIDELGLQFEDANYLVPQLPRSGEISSKAAKHLDELNKTLLSLSGSHNASFWTILALSDDDRWNRVRALAHNCLSEIA